VAGGDLSEAVELVEGAGVEQDAPANVLGQPLRRHLRGELDLARRESGLDGPLDLEVARGVDVEAQLSEQAEDPARRIRFHGVAQGESERGRERERRARGRLQRGAVVHIAGRAKAVPHLGGELGGEKRGRGGDRVVHRRSSYLRTVARARPNRAASRHPSCPGLGRPLELTRLSRLLPMQDRL
jgi:hypothetical protein